MRAAAFLLPLVVLSARAQPCDPSASAAVSEVRTGVAGGMSVSAIGTSGDRAFALWRFTHVGFGSVSYFVNGGVLDSAGRPRNPFPTRQLSWQNNDLAGNGRNFLLATSGGGYTNANILNLDGERVSTAVVTEGAGTGGPLSAVWNGENYVILTTSNGAVILATVSEQGAVLDRVTIAQSAQSLALASAGDGRSIAVWRIADAVYVTIFDGSTAMTPSPYIANVSTPASFAIASDGNGFLLSWRESNVARALRLRADGTPVAGLPVTLGSATETSPIEVLWEEGQYLVLWSAPMTAAARVNLNGTVTSSFMPGAGDFSSAARSVEGTIILSRTSCGSIVSSLLPSGAERVTGSRDVSLVAASPTPPDVAEVGAGYQVVWGESIAAEIVCSGETPLLTRFIGPRGNGEAQRLNSANASAGGYVLESVGTSTLAVWDEYPGGQTPGVMRVARFDAEGVRRESGIVTTSRFFFGLTASRSGSRLFLAWLQEKEGMFATFDVYGAMLDETGAVVEGPTLLSGAGDSALWLVAGSDGERSIVAWLNNATNIVALELDNSLNTVRRRGMALPMQNGSFLDAGIRDDAAVIIAASFADGRASLLAIDPFQNTVTALPRQSQNIAALDLEPAAAGWTLIFAEGAGDDSSISRVPVTTSFGAVTPLACARAFPFAIRYAPGLLAFSARNQVHVQPVGRAKRRTITR
jgi:hypothetical protein